MLSKFSVKKPYTVLVGVVMIIVLGIVSFTRMTTDLLPNINLPYVIVMTTYVGASPETVEMVVTKPVESSMATVRNIAGISSVSGENYSMVILEFEQDADMNSVSLEIRENLDQIKSYWDDSVGNPIIMKLNPDMLPVMVAAIGKEGADNAEISEYVSESILPDLESLEGIASASATGLLEESVNVVIQQEKIDEINKQVFGYIDDQMAEKEQEIADGKAEIADGRAELANAQKELNDSRQELIDGKAEIADGKQKLADGQVELDKQKKEATDKLASTETQLLTAKADLEAAKTTLTTQIATVEELQKKLAEVNAGLSKLNQVVDGLNQINEGIAQINSTLESIQSVLPALEGILVLNPAATMADISDASVKEAITQLAAALSPDTPIGDTTPIATVKAILEGAQTALNTQLADLQVKKEQILAAAGMSEEELLKKKAQAEAGKAQIENSLDHATMGMGADTYLKTMRSSFQEINDNLAKVDSGLTELYKGNLTAATEFANAQTQIDLGEFQMDSAQAQLEAGEAQMESGQEQINSGYDQLNEAMEQLEDGEQQLADAKEDAYKNADMTDILTVDTVKSLLTAQNFSMPAGYVTEDGIEYLVRVGDKPETIEELAAMPILNPNMDGVDVITLGDVADIFMTDNSADIYTNINGNPGILITVQKQTGYSTGDVSDKLKAKFDEMMVEDEALSIVALSDQGIYIDMVMDSIFSSLIWGAVLAVLILIVFLKDVRPTFVIACSIPISLVAAIVCMYFSGVTLNIISLSGLALGVGMLVDNSIVVIENIYRMRGEGKSQREAAIEGAKEVAGAILASTLTTVCVYVPIVFMEGITKQLFVDMGLTIAYSLLSSLVIALTVVPAC